MTTTARLTTVLKTAAGPTLLSQIVNEYDDVWNTQSGIRDAINLIIGDTQVVFPAGTAWLYLLGDPGVTVVLNVRELQADVGMKVTLTMPPLQTVRWLLPKPDSGILWIKSSVATSLMGLYF